MSMSAVPPSLTPKVEDGVTAPGPVRMEYCGTSWENGLIGEQYRRGQNESGNRQNESFHLMSPHCFRQNRLRVARLEYAIHDK